MSSGLIYFAVIALWVAYFLPRWLRSHDEVSESKSLERYRSAMHVVSIGSSPNTYMTRAEVAEREARTLRKKQFSLSVLIAFLIVTIVAAFANALPFKSLLLPISLLLIFIVHVRRQKVQEDVRRRRRMATMGNKGFGFNFSEITYRTPEGQASQWIPINHSSTVTVIPNETWKPSDIPLPTYVTAPKAPSRPIVAEDLQRNSQIGEAVVESANEDQVFDQESAQSKTPRASNQ
jgi:hypothetical protein